MSKTERGARLRLGSAPDSWGVWFADDPAQTPWERFLDEIAAAGYEWLELGPYGYLPTDPARLADELAMRGLRTSGAAVGASLHRSATWDDDLAAARRVASLVAAVGARYLVLLPETYRDLAGRFTDVSELDGEAWSRLVSGANRLGEVVRDEHGVQLVVHPHADSHIATQDQVERFLDDTDARAVSLCLDTGHIAYCGGDNLALIERFAERIGYVHLKQMDASVLEQVAAESLHFAEAVRRGVACEPPGGVPELAPLITALGRLDADIFAIVEQDMYPCGAETPLPIATRTRAYLGSCGLGLRRAEEGRSS